MQWKLIAALTLLIIGSCALARRPGMNDDVPAGEYLVFRIVEGRTIPYVMRVTDDNRPALFRTWAEMDALLKPSKRIAQPALADPWKEEEYIRRYTQLVQRFHESATPLPSQIETIPRSF